MNPKQKAVLFCTAAIIGLMILFPPYVMANTNNWVFKSGYGFIFALPTQISTSPRDETTYHATLHVSTLFSQIVGALIIGGLVCIAFKEG